MARVQEGVAVVGERLGPGAGGGGCGFVDLEGGGAVDGRAGQRGGDGGEVPGRCGARCAVALGAQGAGGGGVVAAVCEEGVRAELGVGPLGVELGRGAEHVQAVAVGGVAGGGGDHALVFAGAPPVRGLPAGEDVAPAVGLEDVGPRGALLVVVPGPQGAVVGGGRAGAEQEGVGGGHRGRGGRLARGGHLVEHAGDGEEGVALAGGDDGDGVGSASGEPPGLAGGVDGAVRGGDDDEAAFAAGLDERLDLVLGLGLQFGRRGGALCELGVAQDGSAGDAVEEVAAAGRCAFEVSGAQPLPQVAESGGFADLAELAGDALGYGAAFELQHLQVAGHCAEDEADAGVPVGEPGVQLLGVRAFGHGCRPLAERGLGPVRGRADDARSGGMPGEGGGERVRRGAQLVCSLRWLPAAALGGSRGGGQGRRPGLEGARWPPGREGQAAARASCS